MQMFTSGAMPYLFVSFGDAWSNLVNVIKSFHFPTDVIDVLIVAFIIYQVIRLVRETRAMQLLKGVVVIFVVYFISEILNLITLSFIIRNLLSVGVFVLVILFQPELRSALEKVGRTRLPTSWLSGGQTTDEAQRKRIEEFIHVLVDSCTRLSDSKTGALIVIERKTKLGEVIRTGTRIDAEPSKELIGNIFFTNSPLHDGAMIVRDCRLHAAGCYLPLSQNMEIGRELGTRHRAALGISEVSDAVVVIVSEETGAITLASEGRLQRNLTAKDLQRLLHYKMIGAEETEKKMNMEQRLRERANRWKGKQ